MCERGHPSVAFSKISDALTALLLRAMAPRASHRRQLPSTTSTSSRRRHSLQSRSSSQRSLEEDALSVLRRFALPSLLVFLSSLLASYLYFSTRFPSPASRTSHPENVYDGVLQTSASSYKSILAESTTVRVTESKRLFNNSILAYVTPWNSKGYDMAKLFRHKFTHVSPVWYQLMCGDTVELRGMHDADQNWIDSVRVKGRPMILPRVTLEGWRLDTVITMEYERKLAMNIISSECKKMQYDGIVLEAWNAWAASGILDNPILRQKALHFVRDLGAHLHKIERPRPNRYMQLIFVIPPYSRKVDAKTFTAADMTMLQNNVDGFSLMTYDYSNMYRPGPNAPFPWLQECLQYLLGKERGDSAHGDNLDQENPAFKVLMGLNFYGNDFQIPQGGGPIINHEYISLLKKHKPTLLWHEEAKEHYFEYYDGRKQHVVYYPSLKSLTLRLEEARKWGTGISIWEIGQGLEYFFDLL